MPDLIPEEIPLAQEIGYQKCLARGRGHEVVDTTSVTLGKNLTQGPVASLYPREKRHHGRHAR
jgi:hypothetical protein